MKFDTSSSTMKIDGLDFEAFHITIFDPKGDTLICQDMYNSYINGYDFGVNINYDNQEDKETMMKVFRRSKFKK